MFFFFFLLRFLSWYLLWVVRKWNGSSGGNGHGWVGTFFCVVFKRETNRTSLPFWRSQILRAHIPPPPPAPPKKYTHPQHYQLHRVCMCFLKCQGIRFPTKGWIDEMHRHRYLKGLLGSDVVSLRGYAACWVHRHVSSRTLRIWPSLTRICLFSPVGFTGNASLLDCFDFSGDSSKWRVYIGRGNELE